MRLFERMVSFFFFFDVGPFFFSCTLFFLVFLVCIVCACGFGCLQAPSDCGLAIGSGWLLAPPPRDGPPLNLHLLGPTLFDLPYANDHRGAGTGSSTNGVRRSAGGMAVQPLPEPVLTLAGGVQLAALGGVRLGGGDPVRPLGGRAGLELGVRARVSPLG